MTLKIFSFFRRYRKEVHCKFLSTLRHLWSRDPRVGSRILSGTSRDPDKGQTFYLTGTDGGLLFYSSTPCYGPFVGLRYSSSGSHGLSFIVDVFCPSPVQGPYSGRLLCFPGTGSAREEGRPFRREDTYTREYVVVSARPRPPLTVSTHGYRDSIVLSPFCCQTLSSHLRRLVSSKWTNVVPPVSSRPVTVLGVLSSSKKEGLLLFPLPNLYRYLSSI